MLYSKPFESRLDNIINFTLEIAVSLYLYAQIALTDFMVVNHFREELGWILAFIIMGAVALNLLVFIAGLALKAFTMVKKCFKSKDSTVPIKPLLQIACKPQEQLVVEEFQAETKVPESHLEEQKAVT
jgi:hypothetical protein